MFYKLQRPTGNNLLCYLVKKWKRTLNSFGWWHRICVKIMLLWQHPNPSVAINIASEETLHKNTIVSQYLLFEEKMKRRKNLYINERIVSISTNYRDHKWISQFTWKINNNQITLFALSSFFQKLIQEFSELTHRNGSKYSHWTTK